MTDIEIDKMQNLDEEERKHLKILSRLTKIDDYLVLKFLDENSYAMQDKKIKVLDELIAGKTPSEIPEYYEILEKYPKDGEMWD